jgi:sec-independent protein translocase protein TatA
MDFMGIGFGELLLILVIAFLAFGPGRMIEISRSLGKTVRAFKKAAGDLTSQVSKELEAQKKDLQETKTKHD